VDERTIEDSSLRKGLAARQWLIRRDLLNFQE
jgi:hypothetical protein